MKKIITKLAIAAAVAGTAALATAAPASAQVRFGITLGTPGYYGAPYYNYSCDPYSRIYDPYRCGYGYSYGYPYYGPSFYIGGGSRYYSGGAYRGNYGNYRGGSYRGGSYRGGAGSHVGGGHRR